MKLLFSALRAHPYGRISLFLALFLLPATMIRLALYLVYHDDFSGLSALQVLASFWVGLRFDISMAVMVIGIPLLLIMLPFRWSHHVAWQRLWGWYIYIAILVFVLMMVIDAVYFGYVHRHVGSEINTLSADMDSMVSIALNHYPGSLLLFFGGTLLGAWLWHRLIAPIPARPARPWLRLLVLPAAFVLMLVIGRGGFTGKPISVGEAFFSDSLPQGYLALNGAFAMSRALSETPPPLKTFMPQEQAIAATQQHLSGDHSVFPNKDYPLFQPAHTATTKQKPNVVVLMLESWGALHLDAMRAQMGMPPLGVTPNFDALAKQGRLYSQFYANGQRSIQGAAAILSSQPTFPSMPFLGEGLEQNRQSFMGELARSQGYETFFLQSSDRGSLRFDAVAARAGFTTYRGAQDIPNLHEKPKPAATWGTWDHNTFQEAHRLFAAAKQPFLGFVFTSTTHVPWLIPDERWHKYSGNTDRDAFLNSLFYADWALGQFIEAAKKAGYYDNTIFVITADHANEFVEHVEHVPNLFHVPLLIVGPGIKAGIDERLGSQFDILPTLVDLGGWATPYAGLGRSLLDDTRKETRAAFSVRGDVLDWITPRGWVSHDINRRVGNSSALSTKEVDSLEHSLLGTYQTTSQLQVGNRILPPEKN
jgi:phosphoglycerol transferase MdoB-like AlkP superfamily enzyme